MRSKECKNSKRQANLNLEIHLSFTKFLNCLEAGGRSWGHRHALTEEVEAEGQLTWPLPLWPTHGKSMRWLPSPSDLSGLRTMFHSDTFHPYVCFLESATHNSHPTLIRLPIKTEEFSSIPLVTVSQAYFSLSLLTRLTPSFLSTQHRWSLPQAPFVTRLLWYLALFTLDLHTQNSPPIHGALRRPSAHYFLLFCWHKLLQLHGINP